MGSWLSSHYRYSVWLLARIALHALYARKANFARKKKEYTSLILMSYIGTLWHVLAKLEHERKDTHRRSFLKLTISSFSFFFNFIFSLSCSFCPQLGGMYASFAFLVYDWLNFNTSKDEILLIWAPDWVSAIGAILLRYTLNQLCYKKSTLDNSELFSNRLLFMLWSTWRRIG